MSRRNSGGIASDVDRIAAARAAAESLADHMIWTETALIVVGAGKPATWHHAFVSDGGIVSEASTVQ